MNQLESSLVRQVCKMKESDMVRNVIAIGVVALILGAVTGLFNLLPAEVDTTGVPAQQAGAELSKTLGGDV